MTIQKTIERERKKIFDNHIEFTDEGIHVSYIGKNGVDIDDSVDAFALSIIKAVRDEVCETIKNTRTYDEEYGVSKIAEEARLQTIISVRLHLDSIIKS